MKNNIAEIRKKKDVSQKDLAERIGISHWWMNHIEAGNRNPSLALLEKIASELDVKPSDLFKTD